MNILIGENIKRLRKEKSITQEQLAVAMNVTCAAVSKWERCETYPDITLLSPLAFYFGVTIDELMGYDESKIEQEIVELLSEYGKLYRSDYHASQKFIKDAYKKYPNDYRIMHRYMWNIGGDYADNNKEVLLAHKEEFSTICEKILNGCNDNALRMDAYNMQGKLLWAEGKTEEALTLYKEKLVNWYYTRGQKSEQLFAKDTPEFLYWVKKNLHELLNFAGDKVSKSIFFDAEIPYSEKVGRIELCGDKMYEMYKETGEKFFLFFAYGIMWRIANDLKYRGGTPEDAARTQKKRDELKNKLAELDLAH